jgi:hypothetical protein
MELPETATGQCPKHIKIPKKWHKPLVPQENLPNKRRAGREEEDPKLPSPLV